jgi:ferredoxin
MAAIKMSSERKKSLRALAKLMNQQNPFSMPLTPELLVCFDAVIAPEEAEFLLQMGTTPHTHQQAASLSHLSDESFSAFFEKLLKKGLVSPQYSEDDGEQYILSPIMPGWFEIYLSDGSEAPEKKEFARRVDRFFKSFQKFNFFPFRNLLNYRFQRNSKALTSIAVPKPATESSKETTTVHIDVNQKVAAPPTKVYPFHSVFELIERYGDRNQIALIHCFCQQWRKMVDEPCRFEQPPESCMALGNLTKYIVNYGIGRYVSKEEALEVLQEVQKKGAIHQVFHEHKKEDGDSAEMAICNCCWDCCGSFGSYNRGITPLHVKSYYVANMSDQASCIGCGQCVKYCPVNAISMHDKKARIDAQKCIGCGQCELKCSKGSITLEFQEREVLLPLKKRSEARIQA